MGRRGNARLEHQKQTVMLKGKQALVTGATAGLGLAVAESLAGAGANIVLHDLIEPKESAGNLRSRFGVEVTSVAADLSQRPSIEAMMADLLGRRAIDILVNNAVVRHFAPVEEFAPQRWEEALAVNLSAPFHLIRLALPAMKKRGWGRIINLASIYSTRAVADRIDYVTTKTAILGMTRAVAIETATTGITCNAICRAPTDARHPGKNCLDRSARRPERRRDDARLSGGPTAERAVHRDGKHRRDGRLPGQPRRTGHHRRDPADRRGWSIA